MESDSGAEQPIVFFDGYCGLCDRFISGLIAQPNASRFRFAPLQGETFQALVGVAPADSIVVRLPEGGPLLVRSEAVIYILRRLGGFRGRLAGALRMMPRPIRDLGYRLVAKIRYSIFGQRDSCRLPSAEEQALFLP